MCVRDGVNVCVTEDGHLGVMCFFIHPAVLFCVFYFYTSEDRDYINLSSLNFYPNLTPYPNPFVEVAFSILSVLVRTFCPHKNREGRIPADTHTDSLMNVSPLHPSVSVLSFPAPSPPTPLCLCPFLFASSLYFPLSLHPSPQGGSLHNREDIRVLPLPTGN